VDRYGLAALIALRAPGWSTSTGDTHEDRVVGGTGRIGSRVAGAPVGGRVEVGGPETLGVDEWARRLFALTGDDRTVVGDPQTRFFGTTLSGGELTTADGARIGPTDFDSWLATEGLGVSGGPGER